MSTGKYSEAGYGQGGQQQAYEGNQPPPPPGYYPPNTSTAGYSQYPPQQNVGYVGQTIVVTDPIQTGTAPDHFVWSILTTLLCCFWIGIFAIMKSQAVKQANARGDSATAHRFSAEALRLNKIGLGLGITFNVIYCTILGVYFGLLYRVNVCYGYYC